MCESNDVNKLKVHVETPRNCDGSQKNIEYKLPRSAVSKASTTKEFEYRKTHRHQGGKEKEDPQWPIYEKSELLQKENDRAKPNIMQLFIQFASYRFLCMCHGDEMVVLNSP